MNYLTLVIRKWLQTASSKERLERRIALLTKIFEYKYEPLSVMVEEGNEDVTQRLDFFKREAQGKVLEVGSYDGFFAIELAKEGHSIVGLDMLQSCIDYALRDVDSQPLDINFIKGFAEDIPFPNKYFDTTILSHTLEHVFDPKLALKEAARVTKSKGKLITLVPDSLGNSPAHLRYIPSSDLHEMLQEYCVPGDELRIGEGLGYVGIVR